MATRYLMGYVLHLVIETADLSINRYKEVEYEAVEHEAPQAILQRLATLEAEITEGRKALEGMLV